MPININMEPVESSNIKAIGYDPDSQTLHVEFKSGGKYEYSDVSAEEHQKFIGAPSVGSHFAKHIRAKGGTKL